MNSNEYELDLENVEKSLPRLDCWLKEEEIKLSDLKEILNKIKEDYNSTNKERLSLYNDNFKRCIDVINLNNKKIYNELEKAILFHNQVKNDIEEKVI